MGILRFVIALLVISMHAPHMGWPYTPHSILPSGDEHQWGGLHPLHAFFVMAGFYAFSQLAGGGAGGGGAFRYYRDRFLRLYPTFIIATATTAAVSLCFPVNENGSNPRWGMEKILPELEAPGKVLLLLPNVTMFGAEIPAWFNLVDGDRVEVARPIGDSLPPDQPAQYIWLMWSKLVPPTFALGMMLWFFLAAPVLVAGGRWLILSAGALSYLSWRFFGPLFIYDGYFIWLFWTWAFCAGMATGAAHQRWKTPIKAAMSSLRQTKPVVIVTLCGFVVWMLSSGTRIPVEIFVPLLAAVFPFLAVAGDRSETDRYLGGLSYPLYCSLTIGLFLSELAAEGGWIAQGGRMNVVIAIGLAYATLTTELVEKPVARFRRWVRS